jgi:hypothetical protein
VTTATRPSSENNSVRKPVTEDCLPYVRTVAVAGIA